MWLTNIALWLLDKGWVSKDAQPASGVVVLLLVVLSWLIGFVSAAFIAWLIP